jgi:23S rRNA (uracil1939-C5)-methyltransferase
MREVVSRVVAGARAGLRCAHFGRCGGCSDLRTPLAVQLDAKARLVEGLLRSVAPGVAVERPPAPAADPHYRTRLLYPVQPDRRRGFSLGIYAAGTHDVVAIRECAIQHPALTEFALRAERILRAARIEPYDERTGTGVLRALHARLAPFSGELLAGLTTRGGLFPHGRELGAALLAAAADLPAGERGRRPRGVGVVRSLHDAPGNYLLGDRHVPLAGRDHLRERAGGLEFRTSFGSFAQVHRDAEALLYRPALALLGDVRGRTVVDAYGGIGAFGLRLATAGAAAVHVVEANPVACRDAVANARANGLRGVRITRAAFAELDPAALGPCPDLLVVDPPRAGLGPDGCRAALALRPSRILHVACSPKALAADLAVLGAAGYGVARLRLADLFPYTGHVEVLALLERRA